MQLSHHFRILIFQLFVGIQQHLAAFFLHLNGAALFGDNVFQYLRFLHQGGVYRGLGSLCSRSGLQIVQALRQVRHTAAVAAVFVVNGTQLFAQLLHLVASRGNLLVEYIVLISGTGSSGFQLSHAFTCLFKLFCQGQVLV